MEIPGYARHSPKPWLRAQAALLTPPTLLDTGIFRQMTGAEARLVQLRKCGQLLLTRWG